MQNHHTFLIAEDLRSAHNVGSLLRTADGLGVEEVALCGYTPYPKTNIDNRPPFVAEKVHRNIQKTALGAEKSQQWLHFETTSKAIEHYQKRSAQIIALEQTTNSIPLTQFRPSGDVALVIGNEVSGVMQDTLKACSVILEIPMLGEKESFNVTVASAIALFYIALMLN